MRDPSAMFRLAVGMFALLWLVAAGQAPGAIPALANEVGQIESAVESATEVRIEEAAPALNSGLGRSIFEGGVICEDGSHPLRVTPTPEPTPEPIEASPTPSPTATRAPECVVTGILPGEEY